MSIEFRCTSCQKLLRTPDETAGKQAKCPECGTIVPIPESSTTGYDVAPSEIGPSTAPGGSSPGASPTGAPGQGSNPFRVPPPGAAPTGAEAGEARETWNPYQAPGGTGAGLSYEHLPGEHELGHRRIRVGDVLETTWRVYRANPGPSIIAMLAAGAIYVGVMLFFWIVLIGVMAAGAGGAPGNEILVFGLQMIFGLGFSILMLWLFLGLAAYYIALVRGERPELGMVFAGGSHLLPALGASVLLYIGVNILTFAVACPLGILVAMLTGFAAGGGNDPTGGIVAMMVVIYGTVFLIYALVGMFFGQYGFLIVDRNAGAIQSLTESVQIMRGNKLAYLGILFIGSLVNALGAMLCGVGMIFTMPYLFLLLVVTYLSITGQIAEGVEA